MGGLSQGGGALMNAISDLMKEAPERSLAPSPGEDSEKVSAVNQEEDPLQEVTMVTFITKMAPGSWTWPPNYEK